MFCVVPAGVETETRVSICAAVLFSIAECVGGVPFRTWIDRALPESEKICSVKSFEVSSRRETNSETSAQAMLVQSRPINSVRQSLTTFFRTETSGY